MERSDEDLLNAYFEGDAEAYDAFFKRHFRRVVAFSIRNGIPQGDAQDVAQETFTKLHRNIHLYERGRPALPWFLTIAKNACHDWRRRHQNMLRQRPLEDAREVFAEPADPSRSEELKLMREQLSHLTAEQRTILEKRIGEELSFKEIGDSTGKSEAAARQLFQRAIKAIKRLVVGEGEKTRE